MSKTLVLKNVRKAFERGESFEVLKDITLEVEEGEFVSIVGPSGCGKSILLYLVAGFLNKTSGGLFIDECPIVSPGIDRMMVFQDYVLLPWKSVHENVLFALEKSSLDHATKERLVTKYIDLVGLTQFRDWHIHKLSGGMKQRVAIARALIVDSKILLMDEPFSALDSQQRKFLQKSLLDIWQKTKKTILFVTHSVNEALYLSDKIYVMSARPAIIKKRYSIDMPRPRNPFSPEYVRMKEEIEKDLFQEFRQGLSEEADDEAAAELSKKEIR